MKLIALTLPISCLALAACGSDRNSRQEAPSPDPSKALEESVIAEDTKPKRQTSMAGDDFTVQCKGRYNLTVDGKSHEGSQTFFVTVSPSRGQLMVSGFNAYGSYDRTHKAMNDEVRDIYEISEEKIQSGGLILNRMTGKYNFSPAQGNCDRTQLRPIPTSSKF